MSDDLEGKEVATKSQAQPASSIQPLRVWPLAILLVFMLASFFVDRISEGQLWLQAMKILGPLAGAVLIFVWWLTASRAYWSEKWWGVLGIFISAGLTIAFIDRSMVGVPMMAVTIPMGMAAFAIGAICCRHSPAFKRTIVAVAIAAVGFGFSIFLRGGGVWGNGAISLDWRFRESTEQRLAARNSGKPGNGDEQAFIGKFDSSLVETWLAKPEWPGFRGPHRDSQVLGIEPNSDWTNHPPQRLWSIPLGLGWSSFAVAGQLLFTQEQRGEMEMVVCYSAESGEELWTQGIETRFEDSIGGPGPRATPTIAWGDLFVLGASGQLMRMDARSGTIKWTTDLREVADREPPTWGFSSSPLVIDKSVIVHAGGAGDLGTLAFHVDTGQLIWAVAAGDHSYSSPQICQIGDQSLVAMMTNDGVDLSDASEGKLVFAYSWEEAGYRALQPRVINGDSLLLSGESGTQRVRLSQSEGEWTAEELWTSRFLKPDFNDFVVYQNHAYGFDGTIFSCINLETGQRAWKRGRYGKGQVLLFDDAGVLLVLSERGELVLLKASAEAHEELARIEALNGKTWNHPVVVGDRVFVRNATEAACFRLP